MDFETVKFEMLGRDGDDGTCALDELNRRIQEAGLACLDMRNAESAVVTVKVAIKRMGPGGLLLTPSISTRMPGRERLGLGAILADGEIQAAEHKQLDIGDVARQLAEARDIEAGEYPESRAAVTERKRALSAKRRAEGAQTEAENDVE